MLTCIIKNDGEDNVVQLTYENLWRELKDIPGSELIISEGWFDYLPKIRNGYVCFVEADCLVSEGYFKKQIKEFRHNPGRKLSMLTAKIAVNHWDNCFYGYYIDYINTKGVVPSRSKKSTVAYPVEIGYMPGAIIRASMLREVLADNVIRTDDLLLLSSELSLAFWRQGKDGVERRVQNGNPVYVNPNAVYATTNGLANDIGKFDLESADLKDKFAKESI